MRDGEIGLGWGNGWGRREGIQDLINGLMDEHNGVVI